MKAALLQQIKDICQAFDYQMSAGGSGILIDGGYQVLIEGHKTQGYQVKYESELHQTHTIECDASEIPHLLIEILNRKDWAEVRKKDRRPDLEEFFRLEGTYLVKKMNGLLESGDVGYQKIISNRYTLEYQNGWAVIWDDVYFQETYPLFIRIKELQRKMERFLAGQNKKMD